MSAAGSRARRQAPHSLGSCHARWRGAQPLLGLYAETFHDNSDAEAQSYFGRFCVYTAFLRLYADSTFPF